MRSARFRTDRGLSLAETMAGLLVLTLAVFGLVSSQIFALKAGRGNRNRMTASVYVTGLLETLEDEASRDFPLRLARERCPLAKLDLFQKSRVKLIPTRIVQGPLEGSPEVDLAPPEHFEVRIAEQKLAPELKRVGVTIFFLDDGGSPGSYEAWSYVHDPGILSRAVPPQATPTPVREATILPVGGPTAIFPGPVQP